MNILTKDLPENERQVALMIDQVVDQCAEQLWKKVKAYQDQIGGLTDKQKLSGYLTLMAKINALIISSMFYGISEKSEENLNLTRLDIHQQLMQCSWDYLKMMRIEDVSDFILDLSMEKR